MHNDQILVAEENGIVTITLNRPEKLNSFVGHMRRDLGEALEEAGSDPDVRVIILTGAGRAFCAGGDVNFMAELVERNDSEEFARLLGAARRVILSVRHTPKPVIASINGPASGAGFNLALACDLRIASADATFSQSFVKIGFHPDWGGTYFLPRMVPSNIACELFFLGEPMTAQQALDLHLVNRVVPADQLEAETRALAERLRDGAAVSIAAAKQAVYASEQDSTACCNTKLTRKCDVSHPKTVAKACAHFLRSVRLISPEDSHRDTEFYTAVFSREVVSFI